MLALLATITINLDPVLVKLGPFSLRWYGLMYVLGIVLGLVVLFPYTRRLGLTSDQVWNIFWGTAIAALIGGRLYYIVQNDPGSYVSHPGNILAFWEGGMAYYGAIFLGVPALLLLAWQQRVPLGYALDCVAVIAPLAQAIGRIGNIVNGDVVGYPSDLPWAVRYTNPNSFVPPDLLNVPVQPSGAYELLFSLALFALIWPLRLRLRPAGMLFMLYLSLYSVGQFILFIWRDNPIVLLDLKQAQATAVVVEIGVAAGSYLILRRPEWFDPEYAAQEDEDYEDEDEQATEQPEDPEHEEGVEQAVSTSAQAAPAAQPATTTLPSQEPAS